MYGLWAVAIGLGLGFLVPFLLHALVSYILNKSAEKASGVRYVRNKHGHLVKVE